MRIEFNSLNSTNYSEICIQFLLPLLLFEFTRSSCRLLSLHFIHLTPRHTLSHTHVSASRYENLYSFSGVRFGRSHDWRDDDHSIQIVRFRFVWIFFFFSFRFAASLESNHLRASVFACKTLFTHGKSMTLILNLNDLSSKKKKEQPAISTFICVCIRRWRVVPFHLFWHQTAKTCHFHSSW